MCGKKIILAIAILGVATVTLLSGCGKMTPIEENSVVSESSSTAEDTSASYVSYWDGTVASSYQEGIGTSDSPYIISSAEELAYFAKQVNEGQTYPGQYFSLNADIVLNEITDSGEVATEPYQWTPIGTNAHPFDGFFDGNYHTITGMYIEIDTDMTEELCFGLFGYIRDATVSNICVAQSTIDFNNAMGEISAGMVVGKTVASPGNITFVSYCQAMDGKVSGEVGDIGSCIGGVVGYADGYVGKGRDNSGDTYISDCCVNQVILDVASVGYAGGIVGRAQAVEICACVFNGSITVEYWLKGGGITGDCRDAVIGNCYSLCTDWIGLNDSTNRHRGAIVSDCCDSSIYNCFYAQGDIHEAVGSCSDVIRQSTVTGNSAVPLSTISNPEWINETLPDIVDNGQGQPCLQYFLAR